jgi:hypothetical protein
MKLQLLHIVTYVQTVDTGVTLTSEQVDKEIATQLAVLETHLRAQLFPDLGKFPAKDSCVNTIHLR